MLIGPRRGATFGVLCATALLVPAMAASGAHATTSPTALSVVRTLVVKGRAPRTGYSRALFGQAWADVDRNGCDTRNDVLRRDLTSYVLKYGTHGCLVLR
ncbi:MAG: hypothetical protein QOG49_1430, partial [Frankiaceae bacterium]|nr:hypothetical protein [Frankiaceae bacterium]